MSIEEQDRRIDYVEFPATDIPGTKEFFTTVFGWRFEDYGPDYTSFQDGRLSGGFARVEKVRTGGVLVVVYTTDLEAMEARVKDAGGNVTHDIFSFPGGRRFHFTDPNGNELAVWSDR